MSIFGQYYGKKVWPIWAYLVKNGQTARKFFTAKRLKYFFKQKFFSENQNKFATDLWSPIFDLVLQFFYKLDFKTWILIRHGFVIFLGKFFDPFGQNKSKIFFFPNKVKSRTN